MKLLKSFNIFWGSALVILLVMSVLFGYISWDAPYYLSISRDISEGLVPYKDIYNSYTPLMMYLNAVLYKLFSTPGYFTYLIFQYVIIFLATIFLYHILFKSKKIPGASAIFMATALFISVLASDGTYIILEVYIICCVFIAYLLFLKTQYFWCGFFLALSFFFKQYGLLNFLPFLLLMLSTEKPFKNIFSKFIPGSILPLLIFLFYFLWIEKVNSENLLNQLTGNGYVQNKAAMEKTLFSLLVGAKVFILLLLPLPFLKINPIKNKRNGVLIIGILINLLPVIIKNFPHYFILTFPYLFILIGNNYETFNRKAFISFNFSLFVISGLLFLRLLRYRNVYSEQLQTSKIALKEYSRGSKVYLCDGYRFLYILNNYKNPVLDEVGYRDWYVPDEKFYKKNDVLVDEFCVDPNRLN